MTRIEGSALDQDVPGAERDLRAGPAHYTSQRDRLPGVRDDRDFAAHFMSPAIERGERLEICHVVIPLR